MPFVRRQSVALRKAGIEVREVFIQDRQSLRGIKDGRQLLRKHCAEFNPHVVHAQYGTVTGLVALVGGFRPYCITFRGSDLNSDATSSRTKMFLKILMSQAAGLGASRVMTVSNQLRSRLWFGGMRADVIPSGVDLTKFRVIERSVARRKLGISENVPVMLFNAGFNHINKRLDLAEEVTRRVQEELPATQLYVMRGDTKPDDVPYVMAASDVLLMLSDNEGSPNVVKEAVASNLPVVSFPVGDVFDWLIDESIGVIVPRNVQRVCDAVLPLLQSPRRSEGREIAKQFDTQRCTAKLVDIYSQLASV